MKKLKLYVGCGLTLAPEEFRVWVEEVLKPLLREHFEVLQFAGLGDHTPEQVYEMDVEGCVARCDLFLAIQDFPSTGLGIEQAEAVKFYHKPTLCVGRNGWLKERRISKCPVGMRKNPLCTYEEYCTAEDIVQLTVAKATEHFSEFAMQRELVFA